MSCDAIQRELCAYHFGVVSDETRGDVEAHLRTCGDCLRAFLDVKRAIETGEEGPMPSPAARRRLRRSVAAELSAPGVRAWAWWERPAAFAFAGAALVAAMVTTRALTSGPGVPPYAVSASEPR